MFDDDGRPIVDKLRICNIFNDYFIRAADLVSPTYSSDNILANITMYPTTGQFSISRTTPQEIVNIIKRLNSNAAVGPNLVSARFFKKFDTILSDKISHLINESISTAIYPNCLKLVKVFPVFKSGKCTTPGNYRPISISDAIAKIFENVLYDRLVKYMDYNKIIDSHQFGFVANSDTLSAASELLNYIRVGLDKKECVSVLFIDFRKAFDCINHKRFIAKLSGLNFDSNSLSLFKSYLTDRRQFVQLDDIKGSFNLCTRGVPQGSVLGALIYLIYANDLFKLPFRGELQAYADDTAIKYRANDLQTLTLNMEFDLSLLYNWCKINNMEINYEKSSYMYFETHRWHPPLRNLIIGDQSVRPVFEMKYLGLVIDTKLCWCQHITMVKNKILPWIFAIRRVKYIMREDYMWRLYYAYIYSNLIYLNPIWNVASDVYIRQLSILQNRTVKHIKKLDYRHPTSEIYGENVLPLKSLNDYMTLILIYKIKNNLIKHNFTLRLVADVHEHNTRSRNNLYINFANSVRGQKDILHRGLNLFNQLPEVIKNIPAISSFKVELKKYLSSYL